MDAVYEVHTCNGGPSYYKFNRFHLFRKNSIITMLPSVIFLAAGTAIFFSDRAEGITFWVLAVVFPFLLLGLTMLTARRHLKTNRMFASMKNVLYKFERNKITCETTSPKLKTTLETDWDNIYQAYESDDSFYIYISNMQAFIIPKEDFVTGTPEQFSQLLQELAGSKYRKR
ncbi:YcxB-like protein [Paenibacillus cellulosilyticus]|uniref:YcxB-like protein n=1 Tax=Paenibacillus cellulosilyticus TaxID=375489 RepID=A0A2V2YVB6_9BACL|nr:YcxB family protein [Paenibacillus cellulosilyticus]PWW05233.1 YcxB-like protein [Paenibacillus cellulosilyticus]QKS43557.1 YcxB family protein [Paenibacillus cellulosilyticus]